MNEKLIGFQIGEESAVCYSRRRRGKLLKISHMCDPHRSCRHGLLKPVYYAGMMWNLSPLPVFIALLTKSGEICQDLPLAESQQLEASTKFWFRVGPAPLPLAQRGSKICVMFSVFKKRDRRLIYSKSHRRGLPWICMVVCATIIT